ncbi:MAG: hypothetical protein IPK16_17270 [Anaerolineales bacterium]|nr:hypothetical protein [Anaerolineales bacterium]
MPQVITMPQVLRFGVTPTITLNVGEAVVLAWDALGDSAEICPIAGQPVMGACVSTP